MGPKKAPAPKLPPAFPKGHLLFDRAKKKHWTLVKQIGTGGFGRIYETVSESTKETAVVKIEHSQSGPLFCEQNFAVRCLRKENLNKWMAQHKPHYIPLPEFFSFGITEDGLFRFIVMQRLGKNLEQILEKFKWHLPEVLTYQICIELVNALEFIHSHGYIHADIKGSNILFGYGKDEERRIYLCDFGLVAKIPSVYKEEKKLKHNGTIEYTSREAHRGAQPSCRGDFEILSYCLIHWMTGTLPWIGKLSNPEAVSASKASFYSNLPNSLKEAFPTCPVEIVEFFSNVDHLSYESKPNYGMFKKIFQKGLLSRKSKPAPPFSFSNSVSPPVKATSVNSVTSPVKRKSVHAISSPVKRKSVHVASPVVKFQETENNVSVRTRQSPRFYGVTRGPLAIAAGRAKLTKRTEDSKNESTKGACSPLNKKSSVKLHPTLPSKMRKSPIPFNYNEESSDDDNDHSILYKTAFADMPISTDESEEDIPITKNGRPKRAAKKT